jgi:hypothetical protein
MKKLPDCLAVGSKRFPFSLNNNVLKNMCPANHVAEVAHHTPIF